MQVDQGGLRRKNEELIRALREKGRKQLQTQELHDKLKRRIMLGQVQNAALDAMDQNIQASVAANRFVDRIDSQNQTIGPPPPPLFSNRQTSGMQYPGHATDSGPIGGAQIGRAGPRDDTWAGFSSQGSGQRKFSSCPFWSLV
jgi:E3 ubiquitin-protein ligase CCNP1IP1